jgi:hypothetical protein
MAKILGEALGGSIPIFGLLQQQNSKENSFCKIGL